MKRTRLLSPGSECTSCLMSCKKYRSGKVSRHLQKKKKKKKVDTCGCKNSDLESVYYTEIKANVYH